MWVSVSWVLWGDCQTVLATNLSLHAGVVDDLVDVVGRDARNRCRRRNVEDFSGHAADLAHAGLLLLVQDLDLLSPGRAFTPGDSIFGVVRAGYRRGHLSGFGQRVYGAQLSGEGEGREGVECACNGIWFRDNVRREQIPEGIT